MNAAAPIVFAKTPKQREADAVVMTHPSTHKLLRGGSRSTKTFHIVRAIVTRALRARESRHAIWRQHLNHARASIWSDTLPKVMRLAYPGVPFAMNKADLICRFQNESEIVLGGLDDKARTEKILGQEYATVFFNEISQISYDSINIGLTRLAQNSFCYTPSGMKPLELRAYYDCNPPPKTHWSYKLFELKQNPITGHALPNPDDYISFKMNPADNPHLQDTYRKILANMPPRERERFEAGEYTDGVEGALWNWGMFKRPDMIEPGKYRLPDMRRIVVSVDPPAKSGMTGAEAGITVCGLGTDGFGYLLADGSCRGRPEFWARAAVNLYNHWKADAIVGEVNNGGEMVEGTIKAVDKHVKFIPVYASRGKVKRAEPVAQLYTEQRIYHAGDFGDLENQMTEFTVDFDIDSMGYSPDRVDSAVWGFTELMLGVNRDVSRVGITGT